MFLITNRTLFSLANLMPAATWSDFVASMLYTGEFPRSQIGFPIEAFMGAQVSMRGYWYPIGDLSSVKGSV